MMRYSEDADLRRWPPTHADLHPKNSFLGVDRRHSAALGVLSTLREHAEINGY